MKVTGVALRCPVCAAPAELRALLTDDGFAVARATMVMHLCQQHGLELQAAARSVQALRWEPTDAREA